MTASDPDQDRSDARKKNADERRDATPLPWRQLLIVLLIQFAEPITGVVIFPFINQFVRETGVTGGDETKTGYFAGIIESMFFLAEAMTVVFWGMASDRFGRRSVLIFGPLGLSITMFGFGASKQFWSLVMFRFFQGVFNGNMVKHWVLLLVVYSPDQRSIGQIPWENWHTSETIHTFSLVSSRPWLPL
ncbi:hypothetical protein AX14_011311 [Amanita brunnescens Koide BX004]|nr:hypothetical protein AX14_011311 [Amanita brunnescens Koide BX004]